MQGLSFEQQTALKQVFVLRKLQQDAELQGYDLGTEFKATLTISELKLRYPQSVISKIEAIIREQPHLLSDNHFDIMDMLAYGKTFPRVDLKNR